MVNYTQEIDKYLRRLFPITRSIAGNGNRETLEILKEIIPIKIIEYPSGKKVYDWIIPNEWNIKDAWIKNSKGEKVIDFKLSNLHVVNYSIPIHGFFTFNELKYRLYYLEGLPDAIPYRTTYYNKNWGFCLSYNDYNNNFFHNETYEVFIDSEHKSGSLSIGEILINGASQKEYLISTYICHPSLANDNLSGPILTAFLAKEIVSKTLNFSYRIVFLPETIGAITYCAYNETIMKQIEAGFVITTVGGPGDFGYKQSFNSEHPINNIIESVFKTNKIDFKCYPFDPIGSDERQYSSQGFRINIASITKDKYYEYDYYHTSKDNLDYVKAENINKTLNLYLQAIDLIDNDLTYINNNTNCEVMLSKYGLYPDIGGDNKPKKNGMCELDIMLWLLFYCDGRMSMCEISKKLNCALDVLLPIVEKLKKKNIIEKLRL